MEDNKIKYYWWKTDEEFNSINWNEEIKKLNNEGFDVVACEPVETIVVKIIGRKFTLEPKN